MSKHKQGHTKGGYNHLKRQKQHDIRLIDRYEMAKALIATHENADNPDYNYLKDLRRRRDQLKNQLKFCGIL